MSQINVIKIGNMVKISLGGRLIQKNCGTDKEAKELFSLCMKAKDDPTTENINSIRGAINERTRVALMAGLETDVESGEVYLAGFNTPVPDILVNVIKDYHENGWNMDAIKNFWKLLMSNPDVRVRDVLFDFINSHDFVLTDKGYMVVYKAVVDYVSKANEQAEKNTNTTFAEFVSKSYLKVKKDWKTNPQRYLVYKGKDGLFAITKVKTAENWDEKTKGIEFLGNLDELFDAMYNSNVDTDEAEVEVDLPIYTDMHTQTMKIELGKPVKMERKDCDADFRRDCSNGLHVGATGYVERFAKTSSTILVCYVNPANVVAVPDYDHSKMRVSEYYPFAIANFKDRKIDIIQESFFESDYCEYEVEDLERQIQLIKDEELPIKKAKNGSEEERPLSELTKILETRLIDIT